MPRYSVLLLASWPALPATDVLARLALELTAISPVSGLPPSRPTAAAAAAAAALAALAAVPSPPGGVTTPAGRPPGPAEQGSTWRA